VDHQPEVFGGGWGRRVSTEDALEAALNEARGRNDGPAVIEVMIDEWDMSDALKRLGAELSPDKKQSEYPPNS